MFPPIMQPFSRQNILRLMDVKLEYPPRRRTTMKPVIMLYTGHVYLTRGDL